MNNNSKIKIQHHQNNPQEEVATTTLFLKYKIKRIITRLCYLTMADCSTQWMMRRDQIATLFFVREKRRTIYICVEQHQVHESLCVLSLIEQFEYSVMQWNDSTKVALIRKKRKKRWRCVSVCWGKTKHNHRSVKTQD